MSRFLGDKIGLGVMVLLCAGCLTTQGPKQTSISLPPTIPNAAPASEGSLWSPAGARNIFSDLKARSVGDLVTINVVESATASNNAISKTSRDSELAAGWGGVLANLTGSWVGNNQSVSFKNSLDGQGQTTRSSQLNTYMTAQVIQVLPNGRLAIEGSRQVRVNNENQIVNVRGIIRIVDIDTTNTILSTSVAEAKIELSGEGIVSDKQRPGWFTRILDWVWPF
jgi:flagellar L-ring protein precursor FlgH